MLMTPDFNMAATPPPAKKNSFVFISSHSAPVTVSKAVGNAQDIPFPWDDSVPQNIKEWFEALAKSHNTAPEYVFIGALVTTAMGPTSFVKVRDTYLEPTNFYAICMHSLSGIRNESNISNDF